MRFVFWLSAFAGLGCSERHPSQAQPDPSPRATAQAPRKVAPAPRRTEPASNSAALAKKTREISAVDPPAPEKPSPSSGSDPYAIALGRLPEGYFVNPPARPVIKRSVDAHTTAELQRVISRPGTRVRVRADIAPGVMVRASDIELIADPGVRIESLVIEKGRGRVRISGGTYRSILLQLPNGGAMGKSFGPNDFVHDVMVDGVTIDNPAARPAFEVYGRRVAIVDSTIRSGAYAIWARGIEPGPAAPPMEVQDLIVARCVLESRGRSPRGDGRIEGAVNEATVRLVHMNRSAIVDSYLVNSVDGYIPVPKGGNTKANYRIHGKSDQNLFARNVLVNSGVQFAGDADQLGSFYFLGNVFYHSSPDLFNPKAGNVRYLEARDNVVYTRGRRRCFCCGFEKQPWKLENNAIRPFKQPPEAPARRGVRPVRGAAQDVADTRQAR